MAKPKGDSPSEATAVRIGEHHLIGHAVDVYQSMLWVPLMIKYPGQQQGKQADRWFSLAEIPGLIVSHLFPDDSAFPQDAFPGRWETTPVLGEDYDTRKTDHFHPAWRKRCRRIRTALFDGPYKYVHSSDGKHELYHLESDPSELDNLVEIQPERTKELQEKLLAFKASRKIAHLEPASSTPEQNLFDQMRALGYLE